MELLKKMIGSDLDSLTVKHLYTR